MTNKDLLQLLFDVHELVDAQPELTRVRPSGLHEFAEFTFGDYGWCVRIKVRNTKARGRGSRAFYDAMGEGETPDDAVSSFMERLPFVVQVTSR